MLALHLSVQKQRPGALGLYSATPWAFDEESEEIRILLAPLPAAQRQAVQDRRTTRRYLTDRGPASCLLIVGRPAPTPG
jgi:hypothetical protein